MIYSYMFFDAPNQFNVVTQTTDVNFGPLNILALVTMNGLLMFDIAGTGFCGTAFTGITEYTTKNPASGQLTQVSVAEGPFQCIAVVAADNVVTVTFVVGTSDADVLGTGQIMIREADGRLA